MLFYLLYQYIYISLFLVAAKAKKEDQVDMWEVIIWLRKIMSGGDL